MKFTVAAAFAALAPLVAAHYSFDVLVIDGQETRPLQYVRDNTRQAKYNPTKWKNVRDNMTPDVDDFRCNLGSFSSASRTQTAEVRAGSKLAVKLAVGATMQHPGPALVYMSKAPSTAQTYQGEGDWFKIHEEGICNTSGDILNNAWCTWDKDRIEFTIPEDTPDGEYLIRPEHIGVHGAHDGQAEFYFTCVQVRVTGGGNGTPGPMIRFPGGYKQDDPSFNFSIWGGMKPYPMPGPTVWTSGSTGNDTTPVEVEEPITEEPTPEPTTEPTPEPTQPAAEPTESAPQPTESAPVPTSIVPQPTPQPSQPAEEPVEEPECTRRKKARRAARAARRAARLHAREFRN